MQTRKVRALHKGILYETSEITRTSKKPDVMFENEFSFGERYVVWPVNPQKSPGLRGRTCIFQMISVRSGQPRATVIFEDDNTQATVDVFDLLTEAQKLQLTVQTGKGFPLSWQE